MTEAAEQLFSIQSFTIKPLSCFSVASYSILDTTGNSVPFASIQSSKIVINQAGNREYSWISNPITLNLKYDISDGQSLTDIMTVTV